MRKFLLVVIILCPFMSSAQKDSLVYFTPEVGFSLSQGEELSRVYDAGGKITAGISFPVINNLIRLNPNISFNYFGNNFNEAVRDNLLFGNIGLISELNTIVTKNVNFAPYIGVFYLWGNNYLSPRSDYQGDKIDLFTFNGVGFDAGLKILFSNNVFIKANFQLVTAKGEVDEKIKTQIEEQLNVKGAMFPVIEFPPNEFSLNNFTFSIGYQFEI